MDKRSQKTRGTVEIGPLCPADVDQALDVLTRGMRDNPNHIAALGDDETSLPARLRTFLESYRPIAVGKALVARDSEGEIVGVMAMMRPGECRLPSSCVARTSSDLFADEPEAFFRVKRWLDVWSKHDPLDRHWHCGPFAVDAHVQGTGIGSGLLRVLCAQLDAGNENAYLETDLRQSVAFFERFGFEVIDEDEVLGATNWFLLRRPRARPQTRRRGTDTSTDYSPELQDCPALN